MSNKAFKGKTDSKEISHMLRNTQEERGGNAAAEDARRMDCDAGASSLPSDSPSNRKHLFQRRPISSRCSLLLLAAQKRDILRAESEPNTTGIISKPRLRHLGAKRQAHAELKAATFGTV